MRRRAISFCAIAFRNAMRGYGFCMDPIRTAVKYALIPLRTVVQLGELFVEAGEEPTPERERPQATARRQPPKRATQPRKKPDPQASRQPKDLDDVALARKVETIIFRDERIPKSK